MNVPTRNALQRAFPSASPDVIIALETLFRAVDGNTVGIGTGAAATSQLQDATVLTLSSNDAFTNERIVEGGRGIQLTDTGAALIISMIANIVLNGGYKLTVNLPADSNLTVIQSGTIMIEEAPMVEVDNYANDAAAATGGVPVNGMYRDSASKALRAREV